MAEKTKIEWATHSFSPWLGCTKCSVGCEQCYAAAMATRLGVTWGPNGTRRRTAESTWKQVERWNRKAGEEFQKHEFGMNGAECARSRGFACADPVRPERPRVFPSLCDPFEDWQGPILDANGIVLHRRYMGPPATGPKSFCDGQPNSPMNMTDVRRDFFALIDRTPNLDWILLTKRPENIRRMWLSQPYSSLPPGRDNRRNVWLLFSASDQASLDAGLPHLLACRDLAPVIGLSLEPLIGPVDIRGFLGGYCSWESSGKGPFLDLVIVGGESGPNYRPMEIAWLASIAEQCEAAGVKLWVKQDCGRKSGQQGRISNELWNRKEFPK